VGNLTTGTSRIQFNSPWEHFSIVRKRTIFRWFWECVVRRSPPTFRRPLPLQRHPVAVDPEIDSQSELPSRFSTIEAPQTPPSKSRESRSNLGVARNLACVSQNSNRAFASGYALRLKVTFSARFKIVSEPGSGLRIK
jgi:hypothetical protein